MRQRDVRARRHPGQVDPRPRGDERFQPDPIHREVGTVPVEVVDGVDVGGDMVAEGHPFDGVSAEPRLRMDPVVLHFIVGEVPPERHLRVARIDRNVRADLPRQVEDVRPAAQELDDNVWIEPCRGTHPATSVS